VFGAGRPDKQPAEDGAQESSEPTEPDAPAMRKFAPSGRVTGVAAAVAAVALAGGAYTLTSQTGGAPGRAQAATVQSSSPIRLKSITPDTGATQVNGSNPIVLTFSEQVAANTPRPSLHPAVAGSWATAGSQLIFTPAEAVAPSTRETVTVPAGINGIRGAGGGLLTKTVSDRFRTAPYSTLRLAEVLAQLGYLPMTWAEDANGANREQDSPMGTQAALAYQPPAGTFSWEPGYPSELHDQWTYDGNNVLVRGAVMAFQSEHNMTINGHVTDKLWQAVFQAANENQQNANGYTYAMASQVDPETLTIWHNGQEVVRTPVNTGIPDSPTANGTFPVYLKYRFQIMSGTNPDGSHYADPVSFVSYFNGGDAVHYFPRGSYGFQQSLGCVELPYTSAERAYAYLTYGSLVTVAG
jgi:hypothetical protein